MICQRKKIFPKKIPKPKRARKIPVFPKKKKKKNKKQEEKRRKLEKKVFFSKRTQFTNGFSFASKYSKIGF
jgi:hypothetical protein